MNTHHPPFTVEEAYDRARASDGVSRYGAYVRHRIGEFADCWDCPGDSRESMRGEFAAMAWRIATGPVMDPSYVRFHPRVWTARLDPNNWDGSLTGVVTLITPWPTQLTRSRTWQVDTRWRDRPIRRVLGTDDVFYDDPTEQELTTSPHLMASATLAFPFPHTSLPTPPSGPGDDVEETARAAVAVVAARLNRIITPVIEAIETP